MSSEKFFRSKTAIVTLFAACFVVLISLGVRQTFGMFFMDFNESLNISNTAFGLAIGLQMLMWGLTGPIFGAIADRYGGQIAISSADARPSRFVGGERIDTAIQDIDLEKRKVNLSIKLLEELQNKEAVSKFSSPLSGKNLPFSSLSDKLEKKEKK